MKINDYWYLSPVGEPYGFHVMCSKKFYDNVAIYHNGRDFRPIVFCEDRVKSLRSWNIKRFYRGLISCEAVYYSGEDVWMCYHIDRVCGLIRWGCREFTIKDITTMIDLMKYYYTDEELGE